jgi:hypothetical protein
MSICRKFHQTIDIATAVLSLTKSSVMSLARLEARELLTAPVRLKFTSLFMFPARPAADNACVINPYFNESA